jgi:hypothetical protein
MQHDRWSLCFQDKLKSALTVFFLIVNDTVYSVRRVTTVRENIRLSCWGKNSALKMDSEYLVPIYQFTRWQSPEKNSGMRISDRELVSEIQRACS